MNYENVMLTVIVITYNRSALLNEALHSLETQLKKLFNVMIFDNGSTDSTPEVIRQYLNKYPTWHSIRIENNWYSMRNVRCYLDDIRTPWVTYLCDDDMFAPNFMSCVLPALNFVCNGLICTGFSTCDYEGKILRTYKPQLASLTKKDALKAWRTNTLPESAGITGFIFRKSVLNRLSWDYTGGFFNDTRLALEAISDGGIKIIPDSIIIRRQWGGATSAIDPYSIIKRLKANIDFIQDMAEKGKDYKIPLIRERHLLTNPISLFRNYVFPLLDCGCLPLSFLKEWFRFSKNTPYWVRWQLNIIIPILLMNRGPLQVFQLKLRRVLRGMRRKLLS